MGARLLRGLWIVLAIIFLIEAWLWDHLEPVVARIVALIPLRRIKAWLAVHIETLSPPLTLIVFLVPLALLFPLKVVGLWLLAHHYWFSATALILFGKFLGVGVTAFVFDVTRPKLLQMRWFRRLYEFVLDLRARASALVAPIRARCLALLEGGQGGWSARMVRLRLIQRFRRRIHEARQG